MRLSGSYFDRLLYNVLPWIIFGCVFIYFTKSNTKISVLIFVFIILTTVFWALDTLIIYTKFKHPKSLKTDDSFLLINDQRINPSDIDKITSVIDNRMKWSFKMVELFLWL